jgi:DNA-binding transcriptional ArsR family regulator
VVALSAFMSAAGNETRLRILYVLWRAGELCVCDLSDICGITQPAVSRHLKILREKALVEARRDAQTVYYRIYPDNPFSRMLTSLFEEQAASAISLVVNQLPFTPNSLQ